MDTSTGRIYRDQATARAALRDQGLTEKQIDARVMEMSLAPTPQQVIRKPPRVGRNDRCPCGSGKKFKRCCLFTGRTDE